MKPQQPACAPNASNTEFELHFKRQLAKVRTSISHVRDDVAEGFFEITHNGFAFLGLAVMFCAVSLTARPDLRQSGEVKLMTWDFSQKEGSIYEKILNSIRICCHSFFKLHLIDFNIFS